jgi:hydroxyacylglutathione hydrolase
MLLERFYDDALAQASYLIACPAAGEAVVVDPARDVRRYVEFALSHGLRIAAVTETHIHADFVSGARQLARETGARLLLSDEGGPDWRYAPVAGVTMDPMRDGDRFNVGAVEFTVRHTPGHTPEHVCFVVTDRAATDRPLGMLSGDFIFAGDVGRPDLLERAARVAGSMDVMARRLFDSLRKTRDLPEYLQLWPGHGAGSACGKALGAVPSTTLGYERLTNWAFQIDDEDAFVAAALAGQPEPPRYFARMKTMNRDGAPDLPQRTALDELDVLGLHDQMTAGAWVVDLRPTAAFAAEHVPGTINIPAGKQLATWGGSLLPADTPLVLLADSQQAALAAATSLAAIGLDRVVGWAGPAIRRGWRDAGRPLGSVSQVGVHDVAPGAMRIMDVRARTEWDAGHIPGAEHAFLGNLLEQVRDLPHDAPIVAQCQGGSRSAIAASLLRANGFTNVRNLAGGFGAWRAAGLPVDDQS